MPHASLGVAPIENLRPTARRVGPLLASSKTEEPYGSHPPGYSTIFLWVSIKPSDRGHRHTVFGRPGIEQRGCGRPRYALEAPIRLDQEGQLPFSEAKDAGLSDVRYKLFADALVDAVCHVAHLIVVCGILPALMLGNPGFYHAMCVKVFFTFFALRL
jgi:hypothetical protein